MLIWYLLRTEHLGLDHQSGLCDEVSTCSQPLRLLSHKSCYETQWTQLYPQKKYHKKAAEAGFGVLEFWSKISFRHPETHLYTMFININVFSLPISDFIPHLCFASSYARECSWVKGDNVMGVGRWVCAPMAGGQPQMSFLRCTHAGCLLLLLFVLYVFRQSSTDLGWTGWAVSPRGLFIPSSVPGLQMSTSVRSSQTVLKVRLFLPVFRHLPPWMNHHNQLSFS